jgi:hypothetical protein
MKDAKLIGLIAMSVEASIVSPPAKGFLWRGFLGPCPAMQVISFPSKMGEPSQKDHASVLETKGSRKVKNLECSIKFDTRGVRSSLGKGKRTIHVM